jgi:magnesium transporter
MADAEHAVNAAQATRALRMLCHTADGQVQTLGSLDALGKALADPHVTVWVDLDDIALSDAEHLLTKVFTFHPLLVDDMLHEAHTPKINDYGAYLQLVMHGINFHRGDEALDTDEVDIVLGPNYLVTHHVEQVHALEQLWQACLRDGRPLAGGADHLAYELVDVLISDFMPAIDEIDEAIDLIEDEVFADPTPHTLNRIFQLKRAVLHLRRIIAPSREVVNRMARDSYAAIDEHDRLYFRNIYDQLVRMYDLNESLRDLASGALDTYLSVTSFHINEIMKVLTIFTALFMPISFLAGFFGQNFTMIPFNSPWLMAGAITLMIAAPATMLVYLRRKKWL